jgi:hypothetical protein
VAQLPLKPVRTATMLCAPPSEPESP